MTKQVDGGTVLEDRVVYVTAATVIRKDGATTPETEVAGVVLAVTTGAEPTIKIKTAAGQEPTYKVSATASITLDGQAATPGEILPGDSATLKVSAPDVATSIAATCAWGAG